MLGKGACGHPAACAGGVCRSPGRSSQAARRSQAFAGERPVRASARSSTRTRAGARRRDPPSRRTAETAAACALISGAALAQITPTPEAADSGLYPDKTYSPCAKRAFPDQVCWGDPHLRTGLSLDAGLFGATLGPEDASALAKGEEIMSSTGLPVRLRRPLDWMVVGDAPG